MTAKRIALFLVYTAVIILFSQNAFAEDITDEIYSATGADQLWTSLPDEARELLEDISIDTVDYTQVSQMDVTEFISALLPSLKRSFAAPVKYGGMLLAAVLICVLAGTVTGNSAALQKTSVAVCALVMLSPLADTLSRMTAVLGTASGFMKTYVPVCAGLAAASGSVTTASVYSAFQLGLCALAETATEGVILPLTGMLTALSAVTSLEETPASAVADFLLKALKWALGLMAVAAGGMFSLQTGLASAADSVSMRSAKFALSGFIPVVGGTLSDALGTVVSAASVIRSAVGVIGIVAVAALLLPTLAELLMWSLMCKLLSFFSGCCGSAPLEKLFTRASGAVGILVAVTALTGALLMFSTAVLLRTGGAS